ncbi:hypothetical protein [Ferrovibrio terrae]|uniref:hypothetical protein n=1 Tax=Ferrovibrio terrae TaxID=2594003 RepID=UPI003137909E
MSTIGIPMRPAGAVLRNFLYDTTSLVCFIMGPYGSGKTIGLFQRMLLFAFRIEPSPIDGVRYMKVMVVRDTYPNLKLITIPSYEQWVPKNLPGSDWSNGPPPTHHMRMDLALVDGAGVWRKLGKVDIIVEFRAVGPAAATPESVFKGWEGNLVLFDEADQQQPDAISQAAARVEAGRYPAPHHRPTLPNGDSKPAAGAVIGAFNPPSVSHWIHEQFVENPVPGYKLYRQPGGRSPYAENRQRSPLSYYEGRVRMWVNEPDKIRRFVDAEFGNSPEGAAIFREFRANFMVASEILMPQPGMPLYLGFDAGGTPALSVRQVMPDGQHRGLLAFGTPQGEFCGPVRFAGLVKQAFAVRFPGWPRTLIKAAADPTAAYGGDKKNPEPGEQAWIQKVAAELGYSLYPSKCRNELDIRLEAVRLPMRSTLDDRPGYLLDPEHCRPLIAAYSGKYVADDQGKPKKNAASHVADADQYAAVLPADLAELRGSLQNPHAVRNSPIIAPHDFKL